MPDFLSLSEQHRRNTGNHTNWLDNRQERQALQDEHVIDLSRHAGDLRQRGRAQALLQLLSFLSLIQNTNTTPALRSVTKKPGEYDLLNDRQLTKDYQKTIYPALHVLQDAPVTPLAKRVAKRHIEGINAQTAVFKTSKPELFVLVKEDFHPDVDDDIYKFSLRRHIPGEIASIQRLIKQNRLRENGVLATEETTRLIKLFDDYIIYSSALDKIKHCLTKKAPKSLLLEKATALFGLTGDGPEIDNQRLALKVQLYHLEKLVKEKFDIVFRPFLLTPNPKNHYDSTYESIEQELAGELIEDVIVNNHGVPEGHTIIYGPAYQARKSLVAYALYISGIHSAEQLTTYSAVDKLSFYKWLLVGLEEYITENDDDLVGEIANHFYFSLYHHYLANPDVNLAINDSKVKKISDFNRNDKIDALIYHFNCDIEVKYNSKRNMSELFLFLAQEFLLPSGLAKSKITRSVFSKNKLAGKFSKQKPLDKSSLANTSFNKIHPNKKGPKNKVKKPSRKDYPDDETYLQDKLKYEKYIKERVALGANYDHTRRKKIAIDKIKQLEKTHQHKIIHQSEGGFTLTTAQNDRGQILVLSAHAWSERYTNQLRLPKGKKIYFLGPDGKVLLEAPEKEGLLPSSYLVAGKKHPAIFSTFTEEGITLLTSKESQHVALEQAKNYRLKHYEVTPEEELTLAVIENRLKTDGTKMDFLVVDELAGEKKLSDVINLMKQGKLLQEYNKIIFYACREIKKAGAMKSDGLKNAYKIMFIDMPVPAQVPAKRSLFDNTSAASFSFDGYYLYERIEIEGERVETFFEGISPYLDD